MKILNTKNLLKKLLTLLLVGVLLLESGLSPIRAEIESGETDTSLVVPNPEDKTDTSLVVPNPEDKTDTSIVVPNPEDKTDASQEAPNPEDLEPMAVRAAIMPEIRYLDGNGGELTTNDYIELTDQTLWEDATYYAAGDITIPSRVTVKGDVILILADGVTLNIPKGITVASEIGISKKTGKRSYLFPEFFVTAQSTDETTMGRLVIDNVDKDHAGIGGVKKDANDQSYTGRITVNGGKLEVTGGENAAAIGGGPAKKFNSLLPHQVRKITINGGIIHATGGLKGAAIGGGSSTIYGEDSPSTADIEINGGTILAQGGAGAAGIGEGFMNHKSFVKKDEKDPYKYFTNILITGGDIRALGGEPASGVDGAGAGIGGGSGKYGTIESRIITIKGGTIYAQGGAGAAGIGSGDSSFGAANAGKITITGGTIDAIPSVNSEGDTYGTAIGGGYGSQGGEIVIQGGNIVNDPANENLYMLGKTPFIQNDSSQFPYKISNGDVENLCLVVADFGEPNVAITDVVDIDNLNYNLKNVKTASDGKIYMYLPSGDYRPVFNGKRFGATITAQRYHNGNEIPFTYKEKRVLERLYAKLVKTPVLNTGKVYDERPLEVIAAEGTAENGILYYKVVPAGQQVREQDKASFTSTIPTVTEAGKYDVYYYVKGTDYYWDTDIAKHNYTLTIDKAPAPVINYPSGSAIAFGKKLSESILTGGSTEFGSFAWKDGNTIPAKLGEQKFSVTFTPSASTLKNYLAIDKKTSLVNVRVILLQAVFEKEPKAVENLVYNRKEQTLVTAGKTSHGTILYALGKDGEYTETIPTAERAGTYQVYYKIVGDDSHADSTPKFVEVVIKKADISKINFPTPTPIKPGQNVGDSKLIGGDTSLGNFKWKDEKEKVTKGNEKHEIVFEPNSETANNYNISRTNSTVKIEVVEINDGIVPRAVPANRFIIKYKTIVESLKKQEELVVKHNKVEMRFDQEALKDMEKYKDDIALGIEFSNAGERTPSQSKILGGRPVYLIQMETLKGKEVKDFGKGSVIVKLPYTLTKGELGKNMVVYRINENGIMTEVLFSMYDAKSRNMVFEMTENGKYAIGHKDELVIFVDVEEIPEELIIEFLALKGLVIGTGGRYYSPYMDLNRGMLVTVLGRMSRVNTTNYLTSAFEDIKKEDYFYSYANWAKKEELLGNTSDQFAPLESLTREQMAEMLKKYVSKNANWSKKFDADKEVGTTQNTLSRAEMAIIVEKMIRARLGL